MSTSGRESGAASAARTAEAPADAVTLLPRTRRPEDDLRVAPPTATQVLRARRALRPAEPDEMLDDVLAPPRRPRNGAPPAEPATPPGPLDEQQAPRHAARRRGRRFWWTVAGLSSLLIVEGVTSIVVGGHRASAQDRAVWDATSIVLPPTAAGAPRLTDRAHRAQAAVESQRLSDDTDGMLRASVGYYSGVVTTGGVLERRTVTVVAARPARPLAAGDRSSLRTAYRTAMSAAGLVLVERDAGALGGWMGCGALGPSTVCLSMDAGAVVTVVVDGHGTDAEERALAVREQVEQSA